jgi:hypothetical protein
MIKNGYVIVNLSRDFSYHHGTDKTFGTETFDEPFQGNSAGILPCHPAKYLLM